MSYDPPLSLEKSADGALNVSNERVISQISSYYGLAADAVFTIQSGTGALVDVVNDKFVATSGTDSNGIAGILTQRFLKFRAGQGITCRLSAIFSTGASDQQQLAGLIESSSGVVFAMQSSVFGILHYYSGEPELQELTITTPAAGAETATVEINGIEYSVNLTASSAEINAAEIADQLDSAVPDYTITSNQTAVVAQAIIPELAGDFAFTSATAVAVWQQITVGEPVVSQFVPQTNWNVDPVSWLNPQQLNSYEIEYIDSGNINFNVVDPDSGEYIRVHQIKRVNNTTEPSASQSAFRAGWIARNLGATSTVTIEGISCGAFNQGEIKRSGGFRAVSNDQTDIDDTFTSVVIIRNRSSFNESINRAEIIPRLITAATQATKPAFMEVLVNPVFVGDVIFDYIDKQNSLIEYSLQALPASGGRLLAAATIGNNSLSISVNGGDDKDVAIAPNDIICVAARMSALPVSDVQVSVTMLEDL